MTSDDRNKSKKAMGQFEERDTSPEHLQWQRVKVSDNTYSGSLLNTFTTSEGGHSHFILSNPNVCIATLV